MIEAISEHVPLVIAELVNSYCLPLSISSFGLTFSSGSIYAEYRYRLVSLRDNDTGEERKPSLSIVDGIIYTLQRDEEGEYRFYNFGFDTVGDDQFLIEGWIEDPALTILRSQTINQEENCEVCNVRHKRFGCNICSDCFTYALDFEADSNLLFKMKEKRSDKENEEISQGELYGTEEVNNIIYEFNLEFVHCSFVIE